MGKQELPSLSVEQMKGVLIGNTLPKRPEYPETVDHTIFGDIISEGGGSLIDQATRELMGMYTRKH